ncbi:MAG: ATP-dependent Clp protease ATP-binding subunit, partial [Proteobacteria bacterium]|nr:ATP-dependent Clp protease ATP-binding subunit [Pseudomonadota bacterium]
MKVSASVVLRYCPALDGFLKVRILTDTEVCRLLGRARFEGRSDYVRFLLGVCLPEYPARILPELLSRLGEGTGELAGVEEALYGLCVDLNPHLDITRVAIPVADAGRAELYLLEGPGTLPSGEEDAHTYLELETLLSGRVIGQREAIEKLARVLRRAAAGLRDPDRPVGSFFFLGQTGVGKTELAKAVADVLFRGEDRLVRVDCSEYSQPHEYAKLIGAPPGYIGHQEGGTLTEALLAKGRCVVLFDEIEKAHPKVHQLLLQVLDEGVLTDNKGRQAWFRDAVVILTSNVGAREVEDLDRRVGFGASPREEDARAESLKALRREFPPEFVNRIDEIVVFRPLGREDSLRICELLLADVARYLEPKGLGIEFDPEVVAFLVDEGTDARYGARPLRRTIQRHVLNPLAEDLLAGAFCSSRRIRAHLEQPRIVFE